MKALKVKDCTVAYGGKDVLHSLNLEVAKGEFLVVIGPNGSGKTTLLKALAGLVPCQAGRMEIQGHSLETMGRRQLARMLALVPQQTPEDFPFTVTETVLMGRFPHHGLAGRETRADRDIARQAMAFTEVGHLAGRRLNALSGGERQRVIIARALCQQPQIILLDEPTASLDPAHQIKIMDLMERLRREHQVSVVMVSHDLNLSAMYCDRMLLLDHGHVAAMGTPAEVLTYKTLERVYGCVFLVDHGPVSGSIRVAPVPGRMLGSGKAEDLPRPRGSE